MTAAAKQRLRSRLLQRLRRQTEEARQSKSQAIRRRVTRLAAFRRAAVVCCYVALPYEVQTWELILRMLARGKRVVVPAVDRKTDDLALFEIRDPGRELAPGAYGVLEPLPAFRRPVAPKAVDLILVPGLAFDRRGFRLGHGKGYYDRLLARVPAEVPTVGLSFDFQVLKVLPTAAHDCAVHRVLTN